MMEHAKRTYPINKLIPILLLCYFMLTIGATIGLMWQKSEVTPIVLVEPGIGGFKPIEGSSIGNTWSKSEVIPVLLVKQSIGGFVPREGSSIGNIWSSDNIIPVILVKPSGNEFVPLIFDENTTDINNLNDTNNTSYTSSVIVSKVDGDFNGWDGETIVKLINGQIWQQVEYHYDYSYSYQPDVIIYRVGDIYKMRIEGVDMAVSVTRIK